MLRLARSPNLYTFAAATSVVRSAFKHALVFFSAAHLDFVADTSAARISFKRCASSRTRALAAAASSFSLALHLRVSSLSNMFLSFSRNASSRAYCIWVAAATYWSLVKITDFEKSTTGSFMRGLQSCVTIGRVRKRVMDSGSSPSLSMPAISSSRAWSIESLSTKKWCVPRVGT
jgi:hypothetical protein